MFFRERERELYQWNSFECILHFIGNKLNYNYFESRQI
jgi:hypothetical protein